MSAAEQGVAADGACAPLLNAIPFGGRIVAKKRRRFVGEELCFTGRVRP